MQFIAGLRNWQRFSFNDKIKFTYKIYDLDGSGYVEPGELVHLTEHTSNELAQAVCLADTNATWRNQDAMKAVMLTFLLVADG